MCGYRSRSDRGDFNAHLLGLDGWQNFRGDLLESFAADHRLMILNFSDKCSGHYTRETAVIDYVLCSGNALKTLQKVTIDDSRQYTTLTDHNLIIVQCKVDQCGRQKKTKSVLSLNSKRTADLTEKRLKELKDSVPVTYSVLRDETKSTESRGERDNLTRE